MRLFHNYRTDSTWGSVPVGGIVVQDFRNDSVDIFREHALKSKRIDEKDLLATSEQLLDSLNLLEDGIIKKELNVIEKQIIEVILQFPTLSQKKISIMLDEKYSKVKFYMEELKKKKIIYR